MSMKSNPNISIIVPTYNESQNIIKILKKINDHIPRDVFSETIVVDDNSPDNTGKIVEEYINEVRKLANNTINIIHRKTKAGLSSAILNGIQKARGETIVVLDSDLSHPPNVIPKLIKAIREYHFDLAIASRYVPGGKVSGWTLKRKIMSKVATKIAKKFLGIQSSDPLSGFFAFKKNLIQGLNFDALGYKILLEILVKTKGAKIQEIPYTFQDRKFGNSKMNISTITDFLKAVFKLYKYGKSVESKETRSSIRFLSKAARFYTVGASGFGVNYLISLQLSGVPEFWYIHATTIGIIASMTSNFVLNKVWTFEDKDFSIKKTLSQYGKFIGFSSIGATVQLGMVFSLIDLYEISYPVALGLGVLTGALGNYILNKKWTFKEKLWG